MIRTHGLRKTFGTLDAVQGLDLHVKEGSATALVGANGAGKSTTIRVIMNLLQPDSGEAEVMGRDSRKLSPAELQRIGYVAESQKLPMAMKLGEYLTYLSALYPDWDRELAASLLLKLQLDVEQKLGRLSHGMRMKAALVAALSYRPDLLVLDEPLTGLDPHVRDQLLENLLGHAEGTTILISSHELYELEGAVTDIAFIESGRLKFQQPLEEIGGRFRDVVVILEGDPPKPMPDLPPAWIAPKLVGRTLAFTAADFTTEDDLRRRVAAHVSGIQSVEFSPMSLRAVAKSLMQDAVEGVRA
jgi:ABC-2 type transport system ATP-binding protein